MKLGDTAQPKLLSQEFFKEYGYLPIIENGVVKKILCSKHTDLNMMSVIRFNLGYDFKLEINKDEEINRLLKNLTEPGINDIDHQDNISTPKEYLSNTIIEKVDSIISEAIDLGASDIHLEPYDMQMSIRYRLDGFLKEKKKIERDQIPAIISRVKILSNLDIAEKRRPQDGRIRFKIENRIVDIRVSTIPTNFGEKAVLRLLDKSKSRLELSRLGFNQKDLDLFKAQIKQPTGIILITGPTGSGKTTTLYAALNYIQSPNVNIMTIEDPIEYDLEGVNQTQIKPEIGLTFGSALRSILRQDPNIIMVGEIRDKETLDNALRASITGHLVLSTVHTNDTVSTISRLMDLGADSNLLQTSLKTIIAQRLVRLICPNCISDSISEEEKAAAKALSIDDYSMIRQGLGCSKCLGIGYWGRTAIYEMLNIDNCTAEMIFNDHGYIEKIKALKMSGMSFLRDRGKDLIEQGLTTPSEVLRETG